MPRNIAPLFQSTDEQIEPLTATIKGTIPKWLKGDYLSIGPGVFDIEDFTMNHWCDGFGVICKFSIFGDRPEVTFCKRHLNSDAYNKAKSVGKPVFTEFGTKAYSDPNRGFFSKIINSVIPELTDNESNSIYKLGNTVYVATESANKRTLNPNTLQSEEKVDLSDVLKVTLACSHVYSDSDGIGYAIGTSLTSGVKTQIFRIDPKDCKSGEEYKNHKVICTLPNKYKTSVSYSHSFGLAEKYIVFIEQPLFMNGMKLITVTIKGKSMWDTMEWKPEDKNSFFVVDKATGLTSPIVYESDSPFFFYHHINTYETDNEDALCVVVRYGKYVKLILEGYALKCRLNQDLLDLHVLGERDFKLIVDLIAHNSPENIEKLWLKDLREGVHHLTDRASPKRFVLPLIKNEKELMALPENQNLVTSSQEASAVRVGHKIIVSAKNLATPSYDLPNVNPKVFGKKYTYFYATSAYSDGLIQNSIVKVNVETGDIIKWTGEMNEFPWEPLFIPTPGSVDEDDGLVLAVVAETEANDSFLLILSADNMEEVARAKVKTHMPSTMHGLFLNRA